MASPKLEATTPQSTRKAALTGSTMEANRAAAHVLAHASSRTETCAPYTQFEAPTPQSRGQADAWPASNIDACFHVHGQSPKKGKEREALQTAKLLPWTETQRSWHKAVQDATGHMLAHACVCKKKIYGGCAYSPHQIRKKSAHKDGHCAHRYGL
eukprot:1160714-Pelagomonas_calceolata.AAC.4